MNEREWIRKKFKIHFSNIDRMAIYGMGRMSEYILGEYGEQICGVIDFAKIGGKYFGKPVISMEDAANSGIKHILIAARSANVSIIFERIKQICRQFQIIVYDIDGKDLFQATDYTVSSLSCESVLNDFSNALPVSVRYKIMQPPLKLSAFVSPLIYKFTLWLIEESKKFDIVLLGARDGFLVDLIRENVKGYNFPATYFYISRPSVVSAGIESEADIKAAMKYAFSGSAEQLLKMRFNVEKPVKRFEGETDEQYVLRHSNEIIDRSMGEQTKLMRYIKSLGLGNSAKIAFVDFVSKGSVQHWLTKITGLDITGLYFAKIETEAHAETPILSMATVNGEYDGSHSFMRNYFLLESIFSSYEPTVKAFDADGKPVFYPECRSQEQIEKLKTVHSDILQYGRDMAGFDNISLELADRLFDCYRHYGADISFMQNEDEFCGR